MVKAECTWGEGPDVLIEIDGMEDTQGFPLMDVSGVKPFGKSVDARRGITVVGTDPRYIENASVGVSAKAARRLAAQLIVAAERAEELEQGYAAAMRAPE